MFRVFDVSRCHPPNEPAVLIARKRISLPTGRIATSGSRSHSLPLRCSSKDRNFFVPMHCGEKSLPDINDFVGSIGQAVGH